MEDKPHIIQKIQAELTLNSDEKHSEKSEKLKRAIQDAMRSLSPVLDDLAGESLFRIDTLSVEIDIPADDFEALDRKIEDAVRDEIKDLITSQEKKMETSSKETAEHFTEEQRHEEIISFFLKTGRLPWWARKKELNEAEKWLMDLKADQWVSIMKPNFQKQPLIVDRVVRHFSALVVQNLIRKIVDLYQGGQQFLYLRDEIHHFLQSKKVSNTFSGELQRDLNCRILRSILKDQPEQNIVEDLLISVINKLREREGQQVDTQKHVIGWRQWLKNSEHLEKEDWIERLESLSAVEDKAEDRDVDIESLSVEDYPKKSKADVETKYTDQRDGIAVKNAGVVILHPFLESLFKNLGFVENGGFLNEAARERAVCLVHYLVYGEEEFPEYELLLPKFLCSWPEKLPVNRFLKLNETEIEECRSVLTSSIEHWEALKNTTIDGLRENFLKRDGIFKRGDFGFSIYIEEKTIDILLDKLPWNLSIIKLKWMDEILTVHWH